MFWVQTVTRLVALVLCLSWGLSLEARGQSLNAVQKVQYTHGAAEEAKKQLAAGEVAHARLLLLGVMMQVKDIAPAASQSPEVAAVVTSYMEARNQAWADGPGLDPESFKAFMDAYGAREAEYRLLSTANNFDGMPNGKDAFRRYVANMLVGREAAYDQMAELCMLAPPPDLLVMDPGAFQQLYQRQIPKVFYYVTFGGAMATMYAQQRVIPDTLKDVRAELDSAASQVLANDVSWDLEQAEKGLEILNTVEAALRDEAEVDLGSLRADLDALAATAKTQNARATKMKAAEIDANRVPPDRWQAGGREALVTQIKSGYKAVYSGETILRVAVMQGEFGERWESWWQDGVKYSNYFGYIKAAVVTRRADGTFWVTQAWFRKTRTSGGGWSALGSANLLRSYPIREKNINQ